MEKTKSNPEIINEEAFQESERKRANTNQKYSKKPNFYQRFIGGR